MHSQTPVYGFGTIQYHNRSVLSFINLFLTEEYSLKTFIYSTCIAAGIDYLTRKNSYSRLQPHTVLTPKVVARIIIVVRNEQGQGLNNHCCFHFFTFNVVGCKPTRQPSLA